MLSKYLLLLLSGLGLTGALQAQAADPKLPWTLMIYGAADNNADGPILNFLQSIRVALDNDPGMEIILFIDRSEGFSDDAELLGSNFAGARVFRLRKDSAEVLDADEFFPGMSESKEYELDSADPRNLEAFIKFSKQTFPARRYGLMIYSHANGRSMCPDEESGNDMYIPQLSTEVSKAAAVDFMALELCNMSGVETAYQWRPGNGGFSANVLMAIPGAGPPLDWDRAFQRIRTPGHASSSKEPCFDPATLTAKQFGSLVVQEGYAGRLASLRENAGFAESHPEQAEHFMRESAACLDLSKAESLKQSIDRFAKALAKCNGKAAMEAIRGPAEDPLVMNYSPNEYDRYSYSDLYDLCQRASSSKQLPKSARAAAQAVCKSMDSFVIDSFALDGLEGFQRGKNGIYMVFPDQEGWREQAWYSPFEPATDGAPYGRWSFLKDGAIPDNGEVDNWFELLDSWYDDTTDDPGGKNQYLW